MHAAWIMLFAFVGLNFSDNGFAAVPYYGTRGRDIPPPKEIKASETEKQKAKPPPPPEEDSGFAIIPSIGFRSTHYMQPGLTDLTQTASVVQLTFEVPELFSRVLVWGNAQYMIPFNIQSSLADAKFTFMRGSLFAGYPLFGPSAPMQLTFSGGGFYQKYEITASSFSTPLGYSSFGAMIFPVFSFDVTGRDRFSIYPFFSSYGGFGKLSFSENRELGVNATWARSLKSGNLLLITAEYSELRLNQDNAAAAKAPGIQLQVGYGW